MAAARCPVFRDCNFRGGEVGLAVAGKKDSYRDRRGRRNQGVLDTVNIKTRDTRKRGMADDSCSSMSSNSWGGSGCSERINHLSGSDVDKESGELSSGSGSDDAGTFTSRIRESGAKKQENSVSSISTRKRKFSPIIWDKDDHTQPTAANFKRMALSHIPELGEVPARESSGGSLSELSDSEGEFRINNGVVNSARIDHMDAEDESDVDAIDQLSDSEVEDNRSKSPGRPQPPSGYRNVMLGCRSVDEFEKLNKINEGTYGVVFRAKDKKTGEIVALKKVKLEKESEGFPITALREINILLSFHHPSIVDVKEVVTGSSLDSIFMVMEYMEHDLKGLLQSMKQPFSQSEVKCLMLQLLSGVKCLHDNWIIHRDLKTSNLLLNNHGELKICDFGMSRQYGSPLKPYTHLVVTLWYRAPELLLGAKEYSTAVDMWSLGCIMAELLAKEPLFTGKSEFDQLDKIFRTLGTPNEKIWPGFSKLPGIRVNFAKQLCNRLREKFPPASVFGHPALSEAGFDLLSKLLTYDPEKRITAEAALNHHWFREVPLPKSKDFMCTFPPQHAQYRWQ